MNCQTFVVTSGSNGIAPQSGSRCYPSSICVMFLLWMLLVSSAASAATYTVTDLTDNASDTGSIRYAVNTAVDGDTITFAPNVIGTIPLSGGALTITHSITITGPGPVLLTISAANTNHNQFDVAFRVNSGTVKISGLTIANVNTTLPGGGGFVGGALVNAATLSLSYCNISNNTGGDGAGGIDNTGTMTIDSCTIAGNAASTNVGGGIVNDGTLTVKNSTIYGNTGSSSSDGGGILNRSVLTVENSTIVDNKTGGGIENQPGLMGPGTVTISNSIVADNSDGDCIQCGTQSTNNLIGGTPKLGPLEYNGGDTPTMMPLPGSPAIGAGNGSNLAIDQRGFARPTGGTSDLGAVQTNYLTVTTTADSTDAASTCTGGATCSLRDAIVLANSQGSGDIVFQAGLMGTISLNTDLPPITANVNLEGPGSNLLTLAAAENASGALLQIPNAATSFNLRAVTIIGAQTLPTFVSISNSGRLSVEDSYFTQNDGDNGGAIFNDGIAGIKNSTFNDNAATSGGGIYNSGRLIVANGTFIDCASYNGNGGAIGNTGNAIVYDSTITGNYSLNGGVGAGMDSSGGTLTVTNSIVSKNTNLNGNSEDDCRNCTLTGPNLVSTPPNLGAITFNGPNATVQTLLPLPGSPAIQSGDAALVPAGLTNDARGFPRLTNGKLDLGAAQTNYTSVQFLQQPNDAMVNMLIGTIAVQVLETNTNLAGPDNTDPVNGVPVTLALNGPGTLHGTKTQTTTFGAAYFGMMTVDTPGSGDTLTTSLMVTPPGITPPETLTATSTSFDVTLPMQYITFNPPTNITYGTSPLALSATSSEGLPVTFQVDSGPATLSGNVLTITGAGTVVVEADAAGNASYAAATPVVARILVAQATSHLALTASATQVNSGSSVTLTATVTSTTQGVPTGTVTFVDGAVALGQATLNAQGVARLAVTTLPAGPNTISATYPGDGNFFGSSAQLAGTIVVGTPGFTMTSNLSNASVLPNQPVYLTVTLTPLSGYTGTIALACNNLPKQSQCIFSPASATLDTSGKPVQVSVTLRVGSPGTKAERAAASASKGPLGGVPMLPAVFFWLPGIGRRIEDRYPAELRGRNLKPKTYRMLLAWMLLVLSSSLLALIGCANNQPFVGPAPAQQTITITATGPGGASQSIPIQISIL